MQLGILLTPVLGFAKKLSGALILLLFGLHHIGLKQLVGPLMVLLLTVPKGLVLRELLVEQLLIRRFLIPVELVWNVRLSCLPHFMDVLHYVVHFSIEQPCSVKGKIFYFGLGII